MKPLKSDLCTQEFDKNIFCHDNNYIYIAFNRTKIKMAKSPYPHSLKIFSLFWSLHAQQFGMIKATRLCPTLF